MRDFFRCARAFFVRDSLLTFSYPLEFAMSLVALIGRVVALWLPAQFFAHSDLFENHGGFLPFAVVGGSLMAFSMAGYQSLAGSLRAEQMMGTLESVLMTRANIFAILLGGSSWTVLRAAIDSCIMLLAASFLYGLDFSGSPLAALFLIVLTNLTFMGLGLFSAAFTVVFKRGDPVQRVVSAASALLGGVFYPTEVLPDWLQKVGEALPITHAARALRGVVLDGDALSEHTADVMILITFAATISTAGAFAFREAIREAQRAGTLQHY